MYMLRLLERWEKKSIPAVLAKGRSDAAYAIAMGLCEHLNVSLYRARTCFFLSGHQIFVKYIRCTEIFRTFVFGNHSDYR